MEPAKKRWVLVRRGLRRQETLPDMRAILANLSKLLAGKIWPVKERMSVREHVVAGCLFIPAN